MKHHPFKIFCILLALCLVLAFTACGNEKKEQSSLSAVSAASSAAESTSAAATADEKTNISTSSSTDNSDLAKLHTFTSPGDLFTGYWQITDGVGSKLRHFVYAFDGNKVAYMLVGTTGYFGVYEIQIKDGKDIFSMQISFGLGLDGDYTYEFSKDKQSVVLTNTKDNATTTMKKLDSFSGIPQAPDNPKIDTDLVGAWADDTGEYLYFGKDGLMYRCQKGINFTFYTYSAEKGVVTAAYKMLQETKETAEYSLKGDTLVYNNFEYHRISADELP